MRREVFEIGVCFAEGEEGEVFGASWGVGGDVEDTAGYAVGVGVVGGGVLDPSGVLFGTVSAAVEEIESCEMGEAGEEDLNFKI